MKRIILILIIIFLTKLPVLAYENCFLISNSPVRSVIVENTDIVDAKPVFTIDNQKKIIIITAKRSGSTKILVKHPDNVDAILEVKITDKSTKVNLPSGFECYTIDETPDSVDILFPPLKERNSVKKGRE